MKIKKGVSPMGDFGSDIYTITDEEGNNYELEHVDTIELNGVYYLAFLPADMDPDDEDYGIVLLKQVPGTEELENLEDDEEEDIYNRFMERLFSEDDEG